MNKWITIIGIGEDGVEGLGNRARQIIDMAELLVGGERHLAHVPEGAPERFKWGKDFEQGFRVIQDKKGRRVVVLASGDPLHFGIGTKLLSRFGAQVKEIIPAPSAFSLAAARMGWSIADVNCVTVHGRALETINLYLRPEGRILLLSWDGTTAAKIAALLKDKGYGKSVISVLENIGSHQERRIDGNAEFWSSRETASLNTIAVYLKADPKAPAWSRAPGLSESAYSHDNMITKREVRAITLAALAPLPGELLWDVGAGSGSVAIEWMRIEPSARAIAIEKVHSRAKNVRLNANSLGVPGLEVLETEAPIAFEQIEEDPDAIFIGGGVNSVLLSGCWQRLKLGGRLVANTVTLDGHAALISQRNKNGGELINIAISRESSVGSRMAMKPLMEIWQLRGTKC